MIKKTLSKFWKDLIIILLVILLFSSVRSCNVQKSNAEIAINAKDSAYNVARYYKNREGELIAQVKTHEVTISQLKDNEETLGIDNKKLKKQIGSLNNLVAYWQGKGSVVYHDTIQTVLVDTVIQDKPFKVFQYEDTYLSAKGFIDNLDNKITLEYNYSLNFDFKITSYYKSTGFLKKKQLVTDIYFSDPHLKLSEFKGVVIKQPPKRWYETRGAAIGFGFVLGTYLVLKL